MLRIALLNSKMDECPSPFGLVRVGAMSARATEVSRSGRNEPSPEPLAQVVEWIELLAQSKAADGLREA